MFQKTNPVKKVIHQRVTVIETIAEEPSIVHSDADGSFVPMPEIDNDWEFVPSDKDETLKQ